MPCLRKSQRGKNLNFQITNKANDWLGKKNCDLFDWLGKITHFDWTSTETVLKNNPGVSLKFFKSAPRVNVSPHQKTKKVPAHFCDLNFNVAGHVRVVDEDAQRKHAPYFVAGINLLLLQAGSCYQLADDVVSKATTVQQRMDIQTWKGSVFYFGIYSDKQTVRPRHWRSC